MRQPGSTFHVAMVALFFLALPIPGIWLIAGPRAEVSIAEKRKLATFPPVTLRASTFRKFPAAFETYFNDHFIGRDALVHLHHYVKAMWLDRSPVSKVLLGKDGWLFFAELKMIECYRGLNPLSDQELVTLAHEFEQRNADLARAGIRYLLVVAPNKQSVYPEFLPPHATKVRPHTRLDQIVGHLRGHTTVDLLDLRDPLRRHKGERRLYKKQDTHWNQYGGFRAYQAIIRRLQRTFPGMHVLEDEDVHFYTRQADPGDLAGMLGLSDVYTEDASYVHIKKPRAALDPTLNAYLRQFNARYPVRHTYPFAARSPTRTVRAVVFRDSFMTALINPMNESFRQVVYFYQRFSAEMLDHVRVEMKPDVVIEEIVERYL